MRSGLIGVAVVLVLIGLWQFSKYTGATAGAGFTHLAIAVGCLVVAMGCGVGWFLTKPKENMEDISITKI